MGKKIGIFIGGMVVGSILTILILMAIGMHEQTNKSWAGRDGLVLFEEDGDEIPAKQLKVFFLFHLPYISIRPLSYSSSVNSNSTPHFGQCVISSVILAPHSGQKYSSSSEPSF